MNKLAEYYTVDVVARVAIGKQITVLDKDFDLFSQMPNRKRNVDFDDGNNEQSNLSLDTKIIFFKEEKPDESAVEEKKKKEEASLSEGRDKPINTKSKDKDIVEHSYKKITPNAPEEGKISQDESFYEKKKSPNSDKSTSKSSAVSSANAAYNNEVLPKFSSFK